MSDGKEEPKKRTRGKDKTKRKRRTRKEIAEQLKKGPEEVPVEPEPIVGEEILKLEEEDTTKISTSLLPAETEETIENFAEGLENVKTGDLVKAIEAHLIADTLIKEEVEDYEAEVIQAGVHGPLPDDSSLRGTLKSIVVGDETEIDGGVIVEAPVPVAEEARHFLHIVPYRNYDGEKWWRYVISPFDDDETARWLKHRDVVTKFGLDVAPCDYWDLIYLCSHYYDEAGEDIGVYQLVNSSAMTELGLFMPEVEKLLRDEEIALLLDVETKTELIRVSAENKTLREKVKWWESYTKALIAAKDETGTKLFAHLADMASVLPETDRWEQPGSKKSIIARLSGWLDNHPTVKMMLTVILVFGSLFAVLLMTGIIRIRGG